MFSVIFSRKYFLSFVVFVGLILLHFSPVQKSFGAVLSVLMALLASFNPAAFFVFAVGSQIAPDPKDISMTLAQLGVVCWLITLPVNRWPLLARDGFKLPTVLILFIFWGIAMTVLNGTWEYFIPLLTGIFYFIIAIVYANDRRYSQYELLMVVCLTSFISIIGYWLPKIGLPVELIEYESDAFRNVERIGSGKGDANMVGIMLPIAVIGFLFTLITYNFQDAGDTESEHKPGVGVFTTLGLICFIFVAGIPPLLSTASRTALVTSVFGFLVMLFFLFMTAKKSQFSAFKRKTYVTLLFILITLVLSSVYIYTNNEFNRYIIAMERINSKENESLIGNNRFGGRSPVWQSHLKIIADYPLSGSPREATWVFASHGRGKFGSFVAHNTYIEMGSLAGLPSAFLFIIFCFYPFFKRFRIFFHGNYLAFPLVGILIFTSFLSFSAQSWKVFWVFMALVWMIYYQTDGRADDTRSLPET
ncbi:MAG TPA: O-antigen ligase family protein [Bacteroidales bacterium]|nr:O-antigen ligase family protein [Bacteroidales bacterium]